MKSELNSGEMKEHKKEIGSFEEEKLQIYGARVHNLKNIDLTLPRNKLVVITGLSGSGKSSLAFDTIYAEGQRRYMETFSAYARHFLGTMERPDVDKITGLSPVISIEQKSTNNNPRSTVGTITEIYDFLRLLYARVAEAYSHVTGEKMVKYTEEKIIELILEEFAGRKVLLLAPVVKGRKGHYRELFEQLRKQGYLRVRVDGELVELHPTLQTDRYKIHDIELVIDRLKVNQESRARLVQSVQAALRQGKGSVTVMEENQTLTRHFSRHLMCPTSGIAYEEPEPNTFSFNSPYGACPKCNGLGQISEIDLEKIFPDPKLSIRKGGIAPVGEYKNSWIFHQLEGIGIRYDFTLDTSVEDIPDKAINAILYGSDDNFKVKREVNGVINTYTLSFEGIVNFILAQNDENAGPSVRKWVGSFLNRIDCPECKGARLKRESLQFKIDGHNISELAQMDLVSLRDLIDNLSERLDERRRTIAFEMIREIRTRLGFLLDVGLEYLALDRPARSLSGGEGQRIRLATQIGSQLVGVLYILDEPSIGLHQRDNQKLIHALRNLRDVGNSVIVVEHDKDMILAADHVVDIGPGAGVHGGHVVAQGPPSSMDHCNTLTCDYISGKKRIEIPAIRRPGNGHFLTLSGATGNNLKDVTLRLPLGKFICVTGVSGSGKSSLVNETLYPILSNKFYRSERKPLPYKSIEGLSNIDKVIEIDQSPIGRTPRSNPATYTKIFDEIRSLFVMLPEAKIRGYKPGRFSFNVKGGRCEICTGAGVKVIEMNFLPDVMVPCEECQGKRYNRETLEVRYRGKSISDILDMTIDQAVEFFENLPSLLQKIRTLQEVGLGYVTLGQSSTTLSGGEAQRVKLATELSKRDTGKTLYILDEPTTGLHFEDVRVLIEVLNRLALKGNTILVIEHSMEIIKVADHVIDMGPEGGAKGGQIVAEGSPEEVAHATSGHTARFLLESLNEFK